MIIDRNIGDDANIAMHKLALGGTVFGDRFYVDYRNGSDNFDGMAKTRPCKTLGYVLDNLVATNNNDVVFIDGDSTVVETDMITLSKNRVHIIGDNGLAGHFGQGAKVQLGVTTAATDLATWKNTGVRNTIQNVKFLNSNTVAQGIYAGIEAGEFTRYAHCEFVKETDLDVTGAADFVANGDSMMAYQCAFGGTAYDISGAIIRANVLMTRDIVSGKVARDNWFEECILWRKSSNAANRFVYGSGATDVERMAMFKKCVFWNAKLAAGVPAQNVAFGASLTDGEVLLWDCGAVNAATAMSTTTGVFVLGYTPGDGSVEGIAIQAS